MTINRSLFIAFFIALAFAAAAASTVLAQTDKTLEAPPVGKPDRNLADSEVAEQHSLKPSNNESNAVGAFTVIPAKNRLTSRILGLEVRNKADEAIAIIEDIAFNENGVDGYILSIGGFLGVASRYVAVHPSSIDLTYHRATNRWRATIDATAEELKAAPEFKYPSNT
jgi:hypothetical protein